MEPAAPFPPGPLVDKSRMKERERAVCGQGASFGPGVGVAPVPLSSQHAWSEQRLEERGTRTPEGGAGGRRGAQADSWLRAPPAQKTM